MRMLMPRIFGLALLVALLVACAPAKTPDPLPPPSQGDNPYDPQPGDEAMQPDQVEIVGSAFELTKSLPTQVTLVFDVFLPTPCHQLRVTASRPDDGKRIDVVAYSLHKKDKVCTLMRLATPMHASLNLGSFASGQYSLRLNGQAAGEFTIP